MKIRPPFVISPEELSLWDADFDKEYNICKDKTDNKSKSKDDYRQFLIDLNNEFHMEEEFNKMDAAIAAIDTFIACKRDLQSMT